MPALYIISSGCRQYVYTKYGLRPLLSRPVDSAESQFLAYIGTHKSGRVYYRQVVMPRRPEIIVSITSLIGREAKPIAVFDIRQ